MFDWFKLTPDNSGSYLKGMWAQLANLPAGLGISALPGRGGSTSGADYTSVHRPRFLCQNPRSQHHGGSPEAQSFRQSSMFLRESRPGASSREIVANGIASPSVRLTLN